MAFFLLFNTNYTFLFECFVKEKKSVSIFDAFSFLLLNRTACTVVPASYFWFWSFLFFLDYFSVTNHCFRILLALLPAILYLTTILHFILVVEGRDHSRLEFVEATVSLITDKLQTFWKLSQVYAASSTNQNYVDRQFDISVSFLNLV